ncbi:MAG: GNAT family N-acetyltransferase [Lachnospiraceae bacterium]|nr:GNAT family N-acetyltransferase [Ruminococcus sp.]MCM1274115.1 GNAT family N-acetyltransferase [Lachnospiraceae bacterium]
MRIDIRAAADGFVLLCDGETAAECSARICGPFGECAAIELRVLPEWRRKGMGKKLLSHTLRNMRARGCKNAVAELAEDDTAARRFYEKFGFTERKTAVSRNDAARVIYTIDF